VHLYILIHVFSLKRLCTIAQVISCQSLTGGVGSIPGQSVWNLWWTKFWHWDPLLLQIL